MAQQAAQKKSPGTGRQQAQAKKQVGRGKKSSPLMVFARPNRTVSNAVKNPRPGIAIGLVIAAWLIGFLALVPSGAQFEAVKLGAGLALDMIVFLVFAVLVFLAAKAVKSGASFWGIATAYSAVKAVEAVAAAITGIVVFALPGKEALVSAIQSGEFAEHAVAASVDALLSSPTGLLGLAAAGMVFVWFSLLAVYISYLTIHKSTGLTALKSIVLLIVFMMITALASILASGAVSALL